LTKLDSNSAVSRRRVLALGGGLLGGLLGADRVAGASPLVAGEPRRSIAAPVAPEPAGRLPVRTIRELLPAPASLADGVLRLAVQRTDVGSVELHGVSLSPAFALGGQLAFQPIGRSRAFCSGDVPVRPGGMAAVAAAIERGGLQLQSAHQRTHDLASGRLHAQGRALRPTMWFVGWCGVGDPVTLAEASRAVLEAAAIVLPQANSPRRSRGLDARKLSHILHGYDATFGADGVVTVFVARRHGVVIDDVRVRPETNLATTVAFQPLDGEAAAGADFSMGPGEVNAVMRAMRAQGWELGSVYDRHPGERPRLFSAYQFKTGEPYGLAAAIRRGLDETDSR
jgi:hypothetical protein